jgi:ribosomal protein S18
MKMNRKPTEGGDKKFKPHNRSSGPNSNRKKINKKIEKTHMAIDFKDVNLLQKFMINGYISFTKKKRFTRSTMTQVSCAIKRARYLGLVMY